MRYRASGLARLDQHPRRPDDPFHMVKWATRALDQVRRHAWSHARAQAGKGLRGNWGRHTAKGHARALKHARWVLRKNPEDLTVHQQAELEWIAATDPRLYRAYLRGGETNL
jgi:transposase